MIARSLALLAFAALVGALSGCTDCPPGGRNGSLFCHPVVPDAGAEGGADAGSDAGRDAGADAGVECSASVDCHDSTRPVCDTTTHRCVMGCVNSTDCHDPTRPVCDTTTHMCGCGVSADCPSATPYCDPALHVCTDGCTTSVDCHDPTRPLCDTTMHRCVVGCTTSADCHDPTRPACDTTAHMCVACTMNSDCHDATLPVCDTATHVCVACEAATDCPVGDVCSSTHTCVTGCADASHCATGDLCCSMTCTDVHTTVTDCGMCGHACALPHATPVCTAGACAIGTCDAGYADCDTLAPDGCEIDTTSDVAHCGDCRTPCVLPHATPVCTTSMCAIGTCDAGYADCDHIAATGCETPLTTASDCGMCGHVCTAPTTACMGGTCTLPPGCNGALFGIPWAGTIAEGASVTAYSDTTPAGTCASVAQTRTCTGGVISGSSTQQTCTPGCDGSAYGIAWAGAMRSGASVTAYSTATPVGTCASVAQTRTCTSGVISGANTNQICHNPCSLPWGGTVAHGTVVTGYLHATENNPTRCMGNTQTCTDGALPLGAYVNMSCSQACATYTGTNTVCNLGFGSAVSLWAFRPGWCVTPACNGGYWNAGSTYQSSFCSNDHGDGTCMAPADEWTVTCSPYIVDGTWNCDGTTCSPTAYDSSCTGHF